MKIFKTIILISMINFTLLAAAVFSYKNMNQALFSKASGFQETQTQTTRQIEPPKSANIEGQLPMPNPNDQKSLPAKDKTLSAEGSLKTNEQTETPPAPPASVNSPKPSTPPSTPAASSDNRCLVIIQGSTYDVTSLRSSHPGGDIFICGTDMTQIFFSQHNQASLQTKMAKFKVTPAP